MRNYYTSCWFGFWTDVYEISKSINNLALGSFAFLLVSDSTSFKECLIKCTNQCADYNSNKILLEVTIKRYIFICSYSFLTKVIIYKRLKFELKHFSQAGMIFSKLFRFCQFSDWLLFFSVVYNEKKYVHNLLFFVKYFYIKTNLPKYIIIRKNLGRLKFVFDNCEFDGTSTVKIFLIKS